MLQYVNQGTLPKPYQKTGCGFACTLMALSHFGKTITKEEVVDRIVSRNGYLEGVGCRHASIARTLVDYGIPAYNQEFTLPAKDANTHEMRKHGAKKIVKWVEINSHFLVIASVNRLVQQGHRKRDQRSGGHLVLIHRAIAHPTDCTQSSLHLYDPDYLCDGNDSEISLSYDEFVATWRGLAIFIGA